MSAMVVTPTKTFTAGAALALYLRVSYSASTTVLSGADDAGIGTVKSPSGASGDPMTVHLWTSEGTREMVASEAITAGAYVYAAASGKIASSGSVCLGIAIEAATANNDVIEVLPLIGGAVLGGAARVLRKRFTIAQVNAGATILTAIPGRQLRMHDAAFIAVGGAVGAVTTVDILGTQSSSSVKLVAGAQASLTQNTLLRAGASGAAILAGGVSYVANDANTAITIGITGSAVTTATHIDVHLTYSIE